MWKQCNIEENYALTLFIAFKMVYSWCFSLRGKYRLSRILTQKVLLATMTTGPVLWFLDTRGKFVSAWPRKTLGSHRKKY